MSKDNQPSSSADRTAEEPTADVATERQRREPSGPNGSDWISKVSPQDRLEVLGETHQEVADQDPQLENVLVGIPAYNEEVAIGSVVIQVKQMTENVLVVDDGSSDDTAEIARAAGATVIGHDSNKGKGAAIKTIFEYTVTEDYDALVLIDGDGQHMPEDIPSVVEPILEDNCDMAIGSRYTDQKRTQTPLYRRFGQKVLDYATVGLTGRNISDSQSGFRAFSPYAIKKLSISTDGMGVESEMLSEATEQGLDLEEIPIDIRYEGVDGQTYNPFRHGFSVLVFVLQMVRDRHPLLFFGLPGIVLLLLGGGVAIHTIMFYQSTGVFLQWRVAASSLSIVIGLLGLSTGLILNQIRNMFSKVN